MKGTDQMQALAVREARIKSFATRTLAASLNNIERLIEEIPDEEFRGRLTNEHGIAQESLAILFAPGSEVVADSFEKLTDFGDAHPRPRAKKAKARAKATKRKAEVTPTRRPPKLKIRATPATYTLVGNKDDHPARRKFECDECGRKITGVGPAGYHAKLCPGPVTAATNRVAAALNGTH